MEVNANLNQFCEQLNGAHVNVNFFGKAEVTYDNSTRVDNLHDLPLRLDRCWKEIFTCNKLDLGCSKQICEKITNLFNIANGQRQGNCFKNLFARYRDWCTIQAQWAAETALWTERVEYQNKREQSDLEIPSSLGVRRYYTQKYSAVDKPKVTLNNFAAFVSPAHLHVETTFWGKYRVHILGSNQRIDLDDLPKILAELWFRCKTEAEFLEGANPEERIRRELTALYDRGRSIIRDITTLYESAHREMSQRNWLTRKLHSRHTLSWTGKEIELWKKRFTLPALKVVKAEKEVKQEGEVKEKALVPVRTPKYTPEELFGMVFSFIQEIDTFVIISRVNKYWNQCSKDCEAWHKRLEPDVKYERCYPEDDSDNKPKRPCKLRERYLSIYKNMALNLRISVRIRTPNMSSVTNFFFPCFDQRLYEINYSNLIINKKVVTLKIWQGDIRFQIYDSVTNATQRIDEIPEENRRGARVTQEQRLNWRDGKLYADPYNSNLFYSRICTWVPSPYLCSLWNVENGQHVFSLTPPSMYNGLNSEVAFFGRQEGDGSWIHEVWDPKRNRPLGIFPLPDNKFRDQPATGTRYFQLLAGERVINIWSLPKNPEDQPINTISFPTGSIIEQRLINKNRLLVKRREGITVRRLIPYIGGGGIVGRSYGSRIFEDGEPPIVYIYDMNGIEIWNSSQMVGFNAHLSKSYKNYFVLSNKSNDKFSFRVIDSNDGRVKSEFEILKSNWHAQTDVNFSCRLMQCDDKLLILKLKNHHDEDDDGLHDDDIFDHIWIFDIETGKEISNFETGDCSHLQYDPYTKTVMIQNHTARYNQYAGRELFTFINIRTGKTIGSTEMRLDSALRREQVLYLFRDGLLVDPLRGFADPSVLYNFSTSVT